MDYSERRDWMRELYYPRPLAPGGSCTPFRSNVIGGCGR